MESNTYGQNLESPQRSKNSSISSERDRLSITPSSKYSGEGVEGIEQEHLAEFDEDVPVNSKITKRPSMYHSESLLGNNNAARTSRRQSLLSKRSQNLQQVDETKSMNATASSNSSNLPKFVVTNPDLGISSSELKKLESRDDLKNFVNLMNSKGSKLSADEILQLKAMGRAPGFKRTSVMSQYSGVVEEVAEVHILPEKSHYVPSLVEVASTVHKRGPSLNAQSLKSPSRGQGRNGSDDLESIKSVESIVNLGPLPTSTRTQDAFGSELFDYNVRSPDLSQSIEINPAIPPRSNRRPRSEILLSPVSGQQSQPLLSQQQSPDKEETTPSRGSKRSSIIRKRYSLPPPTMELPLTPSQIEDLRTSGVTNPVTPKFDYASILKRNSANLQDRRRVSSLNRPLPELPKSEDEEDENSSINQLKQDQVSEKLLNASGIEEDNHNRKSIISDETVAKEEIVHSPLNSDQEDREPLLGSEPSETSNERRIKFNVLDHAHEDSRNYKYGAGAKSYSVSSFNTDNASYHTADELAEGSSKSIIRTNDLSKFDNDDNYEDIEVLKPTEARKTSKKHKKKSSSSSSKKMRPFSISTLSKLLESTDGVIIGEEFESLDISKDEKKYIEKIVDVIARLTADMVADPSRHDGTITRMKAALRILEGFE